MKAGYALSLLLAMSLLLVAASGAYAWSLDCGASPTKDVGFSPGGYARSVGDIDRCALVILRFKLVPESPAEVEFMKPDFHKIVDKSATERGRALEIDKSRSGK